MIEQVIGMILTVASGVLVYVISQWFTEFVARPIQAYKGLKAKVAKLLILHACYYSNPWIYDTDGDSSAWKAASIEIRELSAEVAAFAELKPFHPLVFYAIPTQKRLGEASKYLMGLSNSFFTTGSGEGRCIDRVVEYPDIIRKNMGISHRT